MPHNLWRIYSSLDSDDIRLLQAVERGMGRHLYVPVELVERYARLPPGRFSRSIRKLSTMKLVKRRVGSLTGYTLTYSGLDILAIHNFVKRGIIEVLGDKVGLGKEGDVYLALTPTGSKVTVKFHRAGRESFKKVRRHRSYALSINVTSWMDLAKAFAQREFKVLVKLEEEGALVPAPIALTRHALVQKYVAGVELSDVKALDRNTATTILSDVLDTIRIAYTRVGIVHGDLSEYNVIFSDNEGHAFIIDWPQYVYKDEPHADELLRRDVYYIVRFIGRRVGVEINLEDALKYVRGETEAPPQL
ncbi:MAG: serine/threonine-protein kinase RIO2 [Aeropyrum sp.]|nr:serine/threonine-protein kinase RIO2 [Aeropyrum sp.]MCE4615628.1 serine/threonine-protein kinase RIO2 [Aeropyrum sp.]